MTAPIPDLRPGDAVAYRHRGDRYVGTLVKAQRRHAVVKGRHGLLSVPWTAVDGRAPRKPKAGPA